MSPPMATRSSSSFSIRSMKLLSRSAAMAVMPSMLRGLCGVCARQCPQDGECLGVIGRVLHPARAVIAVLLVGETQAVGEALIKPVQRASDGREALAEKVN